jgi:hypothetical protein
MPLQPAEPQPGSCSTGQSDRFSSLEWLVIAIGARDESVPLQWSPFGRSLLALLGGGPQPLASPCLETLRRTASIARHYGWTMPSADVGAFLMAGWSEAQLEQMIESVCPHGPASDRWPVTDAATTSLQTLLIEPIRPSIEVYA